MSFRVELSSGKVLTGIEPNGTGYVSAGEVTPEDFAGGLSRVVVKGKYDYEGAQEMEMVYEYPELGGIKKLGDGWFFWFKEASEEARAAMKAQADVEYVAMMMGVEL